MVSDLITPTAADVCKPAELTFQIPESDWPEVMALPNSARAGRMVRNELLEMLRAMEAIHHAGNVRQACKAQERLFGKRRGFSATALRRKYYAYVKAGDWRALLDRAKAGPKYWEGGDDIGLPEAFVEFVRQLVEENQRCNSAGFRELYRIWERGMDSRGRVFTAIPGYTAWPKASPHSARRLPAGWTPSNLSRHLGTKHQIKAARVGRTAARQHLPPVLTSRVGLKLGQYVLFDDHEFNLKVNFPGQIKAMRPRGLFGLDLLSGNIFAQLFKPTLWDAEEQAKRTLKERDMFWLVVNTLTDTGYRTDDVGTTFIVEHGTAAIRPDFEERIARVTRDKVKVERSGKSGEPAFAGLFEGAVKGNYKFKAAIEAVFSLVDTEFAALPAQVGKDRLHCPEGAYGLDRYNNKLLRAAALLPEDVAAMLRFPVLDWPSFVKVAGAVFHNINARVDHELEGWEELGFVAREWRLNAAEAFRPADSFLALPEAEQTVARALIQREAGLSRVRKLSPVEVFDAGRRELKKVPAILVPELLGEEFSVARKVRRGLFEFEDRESGPGTFRYLARVEGRMLQDGEYLTYFNPLAPGALIVCNAKGGLIGLCPAWNADCRADREAVLSKIKTQRKIESESLLELGLRHGNRAAELADLHANNAAVLSGRKLSARQQAERARAREVARIPEGVEDFVDAEPASTDEPEFADSSIEGLL